MGYGYKRTITIDHTQCGTANSSNCPVLVSITSSTFRLVANGGRLTSASGFDVAFFAESDLATQLAFEIEKYTEATGSFSAWVKIPTISFSVDTVFYVAYGNESVTALQSAASAVWDANYMGVWHMKDGSTLSGADSTSKGNNASSVTATATAGQIGGAAAFTGAQVIAMPDSSSLTTSGSASIECWFYDTNTTDYRAITLKTDGSSKSVSLSLLAGAVNSVVYNFDAAYTLSTSWSLNTWNKLTVTNDAANMTVYLNGSSVFTGARDFDSGNLAALYMGYDQTQSKYSMLGNLDEVRLSKVARSASWETVQYNNQKSSSTFLALGSEGTVTPNVISAISHLFGFFDMGDFRI